MVVLKLIVLPASQWQLGLQPVKTKWQARLPLEPDCQMVCFQTKNPNSGKFWRALEWKMLVLFIFIWNILQSFGIFCGHLVMLW
jgi:hypothetical protein